MASREGNFSAKYFLLATSIAPIVLLSSFNCKHSNSSNFSSNVWWIAPSYFLILALYIRLQFSDFLYQVAIRSVFLGGVFAVGVFVIVYSSTAWNLFGIYMCVMSFFHYSEFFTISWCNPRTLSISSFLLNHSTQYNIAAVASWMEFTLEMYLIPGTKGPRWQTLSYVGLTLCVLGEVLRKSAMFTGTTNFAHLVQTEKDDDHQLVTHGVYALCRHPSYMGWFYWSIGTQIILLNPICTIGYAIVSWRFFRERIIHEEQTLLYFFGTEYLEYQKKVGTGLPGIKGFLLDQHTN